MALTSYSTVIGKKMNQRLLLIALLTSLLGCDINWGLENDPCKSTHSECGQQKKYGFSFTDTDPFKGQISGPVVREETDGFVINGHYIVFFTKPMTDGSTFKINPNEQRLFEEVRKSAKINIDEYEYRFNEVLIPDGSTHLSLYLIKDSGGETLIGSKPINDDSSARSPQTANSLNTDPVQWAVKKRKQEINVNQTCQYFVFNRQSYCLNPELSARYQPNTQNNNDSQVTTRKSIQILEQLGRWQIYNISDTFNQTRTINNEQTAKVATNMHSGEQGIIPGTLRIQYLETGDAILQIINDYDLLLVAHYPEIGYALVKINSYITLAEMVQQLMQDDRIIQAEIEVIEYNYSAR